MARPTLGDVARRAGLSPAAVSLILNNRPSRLSAAASERARKAAEELGYRPNMAARSLRTKSQTLGLVSDFITTSGVGGQLIHGAIQQARETGHVLLIAETEHDPEVSEALPQLGRTPSGPADERMAINTLLDRMPEGIIYAAIRSQSVTLPDEAKSVPVVLLNAASLCDPVCSVLPDEYSAGRASAQLLVDNGYRDRIALIGSRRSRTRDSSVTPTVQRRIAGIFSVFDENGIVLSAEQDCAVWDVPTGYATARGLLESGVRFEVLLCLNDRLAFGAYQALAEAGLHVPEQVSVLSFDDDPLATYLRPQLTTFALPFEEMGRLAVRLLLDPDAEKGEHLVPMPLRMRGSFRPKAPA